MVRSAQFIYCCSFSFLNYIIFLANYLIYLPPFSSSVPGAAGEKSYNHVNGHLKLTTASSSTPSSPAMFPLSQLSPFFTVTSTSNFPSVQTLNNKLSTPIPLQSPLNSLKRKSKISTTVSSLPDLADTFWCPSFPLWLLLTFLLFLPQNTSP